MEKGIPLKEFRSRVILGVLAILVMILVTCVGMYFYTVRPHHFGQISWLLAEEQSQIQQIRFEALSLLHCKDEDAYNSLRETIRNHLTGLNDIRQELRSHFSQDAQLLTSPVYGAIFGNANSLDPLLKEWTQHGLLLTQTVFPHLIPGDPNLLAVIQTDDNNLDSAIVTVREMVETEKTQEKSALLWLFLSGGGILIISVLIISMFPFRSGWRQLAGFIRNLDQNNQQLQLTTTMLEEKKTELEIQKLQLQAALDSVSEGVLIELKDDPQPIYNQKLVELLEIPASILLANSTERLRRFLHKNISAPLKQQLSIGIPFQGDAHFQLELKGGTVLETVSRPMELGGRQLGRVWSFRDISNHVADKQIFTEKILRFQQILNSIAEGFIIVDPQRHSLYLNPVAEQVFGVYPHCKEMSKWSEHYGIYHPGKTELFPPEQLPMVTSLQGVSSDEVILYIKNSKIADGCYISASGRPVYNKTGQLLCGVITFRMVNESKRIPETSSLVVQQTGKPHLYIDEHLQILPDFSPELCEWWGCHSLAGMDIVELLETGQANMDPRALREYLEFCFQPEFSQEFVDRLNPVASLCIAGEGAWQEPRKLRCTLERIYSGEAITRLKLSLEIVGEPQTVPVDYSGMPGGTLNESLNELLTSDSVELEGLIQDCAHSLAALQLFVRNDRFDQLIVSDNKRFREYIDRLNDNELMSQHEIMELEMQKLQQCLDELESNPDRVKEIKPVFQETVEMLHSSLDEFTNLYQFVKENSTLNIEDKNLNALLI